MKLDDYLPVQKRWAAAAAACRNSTDVVPAIIGPGQYAREQGLSLDLVLLLDRISVADQSFRSPTYDAERQTPIDRDNERLIDSLYRQHETYLGRSLVGQRYQTAMWLVIQHSRPETMERYLPVIAAAVQNGELPETPLRMLIDRTTTIRTGKQVFGSQVGVDLLPETDRLKIMRQYGISER